MGIGRNNFDWNSGVTYCESQGMALSSLDNKDKLEHFLGLVQKEGAPYFWTGGQVSPDSRTLHWHNGGQEVIVRGQHPWSFTGRRGVCGSTQQCIQRRSEVPRCFLPSSQTRGV